MAPSLSKLCFKSINRPIDNNKLWLGKPILGSHKTWRGPIFSPLVSLMVFALQQYLYQFAWFAKISLINYPEYSVYLGLIFGIGVVLGELINSFAKRRASYPPGKSFIPFDQIDYTLGSLFLTSFFLWPGWDVAICVVIIGLVLHILINLLGYLLKIKRNKL